LDKLKNVFDSDDEFNKLKEALLVGIKNFSEYRNGNVTYGEIMYVLECILDEMRSTSEKEVKKLRIKGLEKPISFSVLMGISGRLIERGVKKGLFDSNDEAYILHGDE